MASITGQQGAALTNQIAEYLDSAQGQVSSTRLQEIVNSYLQGGDQLTTVSGVTATGIFKRFNEFDKVEGRTEVVTTGLWSGGAGSLPLPGETTFYTSDTQISGSSGTYYWNVYGRDPETDESAEVQFAVSYGSSEGKGSVPLNENVEGLYPTRATYAQYRSLLLEDGNELFTFDGDFESDEIYIINIARSRYRERVDPGNWQLTLSDGSNDITLIDDSGKKFNDEVGRSGRVFNVVIGDLKLGTQEDAEVIQDVDGNGNGFGLFYPDHGIIILNPSALQNDSIPDVTWNGLPTTEDFDTSTTPSSDFQNQEILYDSIVSGGDFDARRTENISTSHYFVRATNREFNFSNNPTFASQSNGRFTEPSFEDNPKVYITTVGLYDDANELLAVAKSSSPIVKSFDKEVLMKVKLSF